MENIANKSVVEKLIFRLTETYWSWAVERDICGNQSYLFYKMEQNYYFLICQNGWLVQPGKMWERMIRFHMR